MKEGRARTTLEEEQEAGNKATRRKDEEQGTRNKITRIMDKETRGQRQVLKEISGSENEDIYLQEG